ncbi:MAG: methyltransferase domain-containing protein, partial [Chitinophagia bacterium]|nr:methyltransferase domain-containing protein [Chitinophagia bacterium]
MKQFSNKDIENYYDQTEVHYRMHWKLDEGMGLHYGIWEADTRNLAEAVLNSNRRLIALGGLKASDVVLDAGCGIGGSSVYMARHVGCRVEGITLSKKQTITASALAEKAGLADKLRFTQQDYTATQFEANTFDAAWCIESMETARDKDLFFKEMHRIIKSGGQILVA